MRRVERLRAEVHRAVAQHLEPGEPPIGIALVMEGPSPSRFVWLGAPFAFAVILYEELSGRDSFLTTLAAALLFAAGYLIGLLGFVRNRATVLTEGRVLFLGADWRWRIIGPSRCTLVSRWP